MKKKSVRVSSGEDACFCTIPIIKMMDSGKTCRFCQTCLGNLTNKQIIDILNTDARKKMPNA